VLCPGAKETGRVIPLRLNPAPVTVADDTVKVAPPVLLSKPDCVALEPVTPLRVMLTGFDESWPGATPLPDKPTLKVEFCEFCFELPLLVLMTEKVNDALPPAVPVAWGEYPTVTSALPPAERVMGEVSPLKEKAAPLTAA
jgi:hypothetical protein